MSTAYKVEARKLVLETAKHPSTALTVICGAGDFGEGTVLIKSGTALPTGMRLQSKRFKGWFLPRGINAFGLERRLAAAGWHFFFIVPAKIGTAVALDLNRAVRRAVERVCKQSDDERFNALEITSLSVKRVCGVNRVKVAAHPRHIRNGPYARELDPHRGIPRAWDFKRIFERMQRESPQVKAM